MSLPQISTVERPENAPIHEWVYQQLRRTIMAGRLVPGRAVTLRGLAAMLGVSPMPVREAIRRLVAERALDMLSNRRVAVPEMTQGKLEELCLARVALEPLAAARALPGIDRSRLQLLRNIDGEIDVALQLGDAEAYVLMNQEFHFTLYRSVECPVLLPMIESLWLQFAPFMRRVVGTVGTSYIEDQHQAAMAAIEASDIAALHRAIEADILDGMRMVGDLVSSLPSA